MLELAKLQESITKAGGGLNAIGYSSELLTKIHLLEGDGRYESLLGQLLAARNEGDFRGRTLEVNVAAAFEESGTKLSYEATQGQTGSIDFSFDLDGKTVFIEAKLLGQDLATKLEINAQLEASGTWEKVQADDLADVVRLQRDIIAKSSTRRFRPNPEVAWINTVAVDVTELQLGAADQWDCLLAACGNSAVPQACRRPAVVGIFEKVEHPTQEQQAWIMNVHQAPEPHPRGYLHGVLFLFRQPAERAALAYEVTSVVAWNAALISQAAAESITQTLRHALPTYAKQPPGHVTNAPRRDIPGFPRKGNH